MPSKAKNRSKPSGKRVAAVAAETAAGLRDRIIEFRRVPSEELEDNERNWRVHPYAQSRAIAELLEKVGIAGALTAYYSERSGGKLTLIDGHERKGAHDAEWPTLILDVTDEEADLLLLTLDPIAALAGRDGAALEELINEAGQTGTAALEDLIRQLAVEAEGATAEYEGESGIQVENESGPSEMELQTFEHYDYIVALFRDVRDWRAAKELLGLKHEAFTLRDGKTRKIGLGRVVDGRRLLELLQR